MNRNIFSVLILLIISYLLSGCEKTDDRIKFFLEDIPVDKYYPFEIVDEQFMDIYGNWRLDSISGGFFGTGYIPNFDFLELKETGIYGFIRNDTILEFGKIQIDEQTTERLKITFFPDNAVNNIFFFDSEKYIRLTGKDSLNLYSPCCDRYNYHFVRAQ
jgi:hypothetical protein